MSVRRRFLVWPALYAFLTVVLAAPPAALADELPDDIQKQIDEQTEKLPDDIRDNVRKRISDAVREELERAKKEKEKKSDEEQDDAKKDGDKSSDKSASDRDEKSSEEASSGDKSADDQKPGKTADDPTATEVKKLREEIELQEARFKHSVAMYEKELEDQRLAIEKSKIDRRLKSEQADAEDLAVQREVAQLRLQTELQKKKAEAEQLRIDGELAKARAEKAVIEQSLLTEDVKEKLEERVLGDENYPDKPFKDGVLSISLRRIELNGPIFSGAADYVCQRLDYFNNQSDKPIFLVIDDCPGGSAIEGFQMVQAIKRSKAPVHVVVKRMAASMAAIITTLADHSYCYPDALILHHQASSVLMGNGRDIEDQVRQFKEISDRLLGAVAKKLGISEKEFTDQMYKNRASGDWELFGDQAVKQGWVEHVATTIREEGVRTMPKGMRNAPTRIFISGEESAASPASNGYMERYEVQLKEETDAEGKRFARLPRLSPLDAYLLYNPDGYYR